MSSQTEKQALVSQNAWLQATISMLQEDVAVKDATIAAKDAIIAHRDERISRLLRKLISYREEVIAAASQDIDDEHQAETAPEAHQSGKELTDKVSVTDTDKSGEPSSDSPPKRVQGNTASGSLQASTGPTPARIAADAASGLLQPSSGSTPVKFARDTVPLPRKLTPEPTPAKFVVDTGPAPTVQPKPASPDYAQVLKGPREKMSPRRARVPYSQLPMFTQSSLTHADVSAKRETEQRALSEPWKQHSSQKPNRGQFRGSVRRSGNPRWRAHPRPIGSRLTRMIVPTNLDSRTGSEVTSATENTDQLLRESEIDTPVTTSKVLIGKEVPVNKDKKDPFGLRGEAAPSTADSKATAVPGTGAEWDAETTEVFRYFGYRPLTGVDQTQAAIQGVTPPARESEGTSSIIRKRSGDEEQPGTSASSTKRLRST